MKPRDLLTPFGWLYGAIAGLRQTLYRKGVFKSHDLKVPTISVGNITAGGTGKTPVVAFIAEILAENGEKVCILTRGYGRENPKERVVVSDGERLYADALQGGDEPFELAKKLLGNAAVIADTNRAEAGKWALENYGVSAFILDDGFQHLRVKRDLDVVLIDATDPFGKTGSFLREPVKGLRRAHVIIISRANLAEETVIAELKAKISKFSPGGKIFVSNNRIARLTKIKDFTAEAGRENQDLLPEKIHFSPETRFAAFCALGNPNSFFGHLRREKFDLAHTKKFADHYFYSQNDILKLEKEAIAKGAEVLLTTAKDAVKLAHLNFNLPCCIVESGLTFDDEPAFVEIIRNLKHEKSD